MLLWQQGLEGHHYLGPSATLEIICIKRCFNMKICEEGHSNEAGSSRRPPHGNTCGFYLEYSQSEQPERYDTLAEYMVSQPAPGDEVIGSLEELVASSEVWLRRLLSLRP